jgi:hypothetical protein
MKLSIIIVSWNVTNDLLNCLASLDACPVCADAEIIVVDNASTDGTPDAIKNAYPGVRLVENPENMGFARANNIGMDTSRGDYVLLLNPDTIAAPGAVDTLVRFLDDNPDVGAVGPKILNTDGTVQGSVRRFPTFRGVLYSHTVCRLLRLFRRQYVEWMMKDFTFDTQTDVDQIMGAAMLVRRSVIDRVGLFDADFFMYFEEVDWCCRIKQASWRIVFLPDAVVTHLGGQSSRQVPLKRIMMLQSLVAFFRKHRSPTQTALFLLFFKTALVFRNIFHLLIGLVAYPLAALSLDTRRRKNAANRISLHALLLTKYLWRLLSM